MMLQQRIYLKNALLENIRTKVKFCKWYSSVLSGFWNEQDGNAVLPYNNFKKAWKDNNGDKRKTFKAIWDFFDGDPILEAKLNLLHQCLTPNEAKKATQIPNYHLIKDVVESVKINNEKVVEYLTKQSNCFDEESYIKPLTALRDTLLA